MMPLPFDDTGENWRKLTAPQFEACRHAREVNRCLSEGYEWTRDYIEGVAKARDRAAASRLWRDVKANWQADKAAAQEQLALLVE